LTLDAHGVKAWSEETISICYAVVFFIALNIELKRKSTGQLLANMNFANRENIDTHTLNRDFLANWPLVQPYVAEYVKNDAPLRLELLGSAPQYLKATLEKLTGSIKFAHDSITAICDQNLPFSYMPRYNGAFNMRDPMRFIDNLVEFNRHVDHILLTTEATFDPRYLLPPEIRDFGEICVEINC
jgi:hypothetical protein